MAPLFFIFFNFNFFLPGPELAQVRVFPTESEMDAGNFVLIAPRCLETAGNRLFVLDQREHAVHLFNTDGDYQRTFGGYGSGPGELNWPHTMTVNEKELLVVDKRGTFHRFDLDGNFLTSHLQVEFFDRLVATDGNLFGHVASRQNDYAFAIISDGKITKTIEDHFQSPFEEEHYKRAVEMKYQNGLVYVLQRYGSGFRIFENGKLLHRGELKTTPLDDPNYQELGVKFIFTTFTPLQGHFFAVFIQKGSLGYYLFDRNGEVLKRGRLPINTPDIEANELVNVSDMTLLSRNGRFDLFCLIRFPVPKIVKYSLKPDFLKTSRELLSK